MTQHLIRCVAGTLHEIMNLLQAERAQVAAPGFQTALARLSRAYREDWDRVWTVANNRDRIPNQSDAMSQLLLKVRNSFAFHYGVTSLQRGYLEHFARGNAQNYSDRAVVSIGDDMEATRFYFADAAAEWGVPALLNLPGDKFLVQLSELSNRVNRVLYGLIVSFIMQRSPVRDPYPIEARSGSAPVDGERTRSAHRRNAMTRPKKKARRR